MEIIKKGEIPEHKRHELTCPNCNTVFAFMAGEAKKNLRPTGRGLTVDNLPSPQVRKSLHDLSQITIMLNKENMDKNGQVTGRVQVDVQELLNNDHDSFAEILSEKLTGSPLLAGVCYELLSSENDALLFRVSGDASMIWPPDEETDSPEKMRSYGVEWRTLISLNKDYQELSSGEWREALLLALACDIDLINHLEVWDEEGGVRPLKPWDPDAKQYEDGLSNWGKAKLAKDELREDWGMTDSDAFVDLIANLLHLAYSRGEAPLAVASSAVTHFVRETE